MLEAVSSLTALAGAGCGHEAVLVQMQFRQQFKIDFEVLAAFESKASSQSGSRANSI